MHIRDWGVETNEILEAGTAGMHFPAFILEEPEILYVRAQIIAPSIAILSYSFFARAS